MLDETLFQARGPLYLKDCLNLFKFTEEIFGNVTRL